MPHLAKRAFLIGINDYPGAQNDLQECVNDITNVYDGLVKYFGFASTDIAMLSDKRATKKAIVEGLKGLIARGSAGDTEGDELKDGAEEGRYPRGHP